MSKGTTQSMAMELLVPLNSSEQKTASFIYSVYAHVQHISICSTIFTQAHFTIIMLVIPASMKLDFIHYL